MQRQPSVQYDSQPYDSMRRSQSHDAYYRERSPTPRRPAEQYEPYRRDPPTAPAGVYTGPMRPNYIPPFQDRPRSESQLRLRAPRRVALRRRLRSIRAAALAAAIFALRRWLRPLWCCGIGCGHIDVATRLTRRPVPKSVQNKIANNEFVFFYELSPDYKESGRGLARSHDNRITLEADESESAARSNRERELALSIDVWLASYGTLEDQYGQLRWEYANFELPALRAFRDFVVGLYGKEGRGAFPHSSAAYYALYAREQACGRGGDIGAENKAALGRAQQDAANWRMDQLEAKAKASSISTSGTSSSSAAGKGDFRSGGSSRANANVNASGRPGASNDGRFCRLCGRGDHNEASCTASYVEFNNFKCFIKRNGRLARPSDGKFVCNTFHRQGQCAIGQQNCGDLHLCVLVRRGSSLARVPLGCGHRPRARSPRRYRIGVATH